MEVPGGEKNKILVYLYEAMGTCFLLLAINWGCDSGNDQIGYQSEVVAVTIFGCIINFGPISGAHFNPAVTIAVLIKEGFKKFGSNLVFSIMIILSQIFGAILGCALSCFGQSFKDDQVRPGIAILCPPRTIDCNPSPMNAQPFFAEVIGTFFFVSFILCIKYHNGAKEDLLNALGVSTILYGMIFLTQGISSGCLNPAVGLVQSIFQYLVFKNVEGPSLTLKSLWIYILGPSIGGILAGIWSKFHEKALQEVLVQKHLKNKTENERINPSGY